MALIVVQKATERDIARIVTLGLEFHGLSAWRGVADFDAKAFAKTLKSWIASDRMAVFISPRGFVVVGLSPLYFTEVEVAHEALFYAPDGNGDQLRKAAEAWAIAKGASGLLMGIHTERRTAAERWYRMAGYSFYGQTFLKAF